MPNTLSKEKLHNLNEIITPVSLVFLKKIGEYKGKQILYSNQQQEHLDKLQMNALIDNTLASNNIDNINIKYNEFMCLFEGMKEPDNNIESETIRYLKVLNLINSHFDSVELSSDLVLQFHKNLFGYKPDQGGKWKPLDNIIEKPNNDGTSSISFIPVSAEKTPAEVEDLCLSYHSIINEDDIVDLIVIAAFILDFLCIHPFTVGNGRVARLLTQLMLYQQDYQVAKYISLDKIILENRSKYIYNLQNASQNWHEQRHKIAGWVEFFLRVIYLGYTDLDKHIFHIKNKKGAKSQQVKMIVNMMPAQFKVSDICNKCSGISRPTINKVFQEMRDNKQIAPCSMGRDAIWKKLF